MSLEDRKEFFYKLMEDANEVDIDVMMGENSSKEKLESKERLIKEVEIWNKMAEFVGYGILDLPNISKYIPVYFSRRFPNGKSRVTNNDGLFDSLENYNAFEDRVRIEYLREYRINWMPTIDFNDAKHCEDKLMKLGGYREIVIENNSLSLNELNENSSGKLFKIKYQGSPKKGTLIGNGFNELEAICNACEKFIDNQTIELKSSIQKIEHKK